MSEQIEGRGRRKRVYYYSYEDLYDADGSNPQGEAGVLAAELMKYYGFEVMLAFTIATDAPRDTSPIIFHVGNEDNAIFPILMQEIEEEDYYDAVEKAIEEEGKDLIGIIVFDGYDTGIAIGYPMHP